MIGWQPSTMPTTMLMTTVNTLLSIPITAMGMSTPVLRHGAVANQHSVADKNDDQNRHLRDKGRNPQPARRQRREKSGRKLRGRSRKVLVRKKYQTQMRNETKLSENRRPRRAGHPQWKPKINSGSGTILTTAPASIDAIEHAGLPSARMTEFIILDR